MPLYYLYVCVDEKKIIHKKNQMYIKFNCIINKIFLRLIDNYLSENIIHSKNI